MRKGLFDRLEDIVKKTQEENKRNVKEKNASASVFESILKKAKDVLDQEEDETVARKKIRRKIEEQAKDDDKEPKSVYERIKELIVEDEEESKATKRKNKRDRAKKEIKIPKVDLPYFNELNHENKVAFAKFREKKTQELEDLIEKNRREEERLAERNQREVERQMEWKTREEEDLIEKLLRKQERAEKRTD